MSKRAEFFDGLCCVKGCENKELASGFCNLHWRRNKKFGSPVLLEMPSAAWKGRPVIERFMNRVKANDSGCWIWQGGKDSDGYGLFSALINGEQYKRAHRFSVVYHKGVSPKEGENVCHTCDVPACVNPDHLVIGTVLENQRDKWKKARGVVARGSTHWSTNLTEEMVIEIRASAEKQSVIAQKYGITQTTVSDIKRRKSWAHVA